MYREFETKLTTMSVFLVASIVIQQQFIFSCCQNNTVPKECNFFNYSFLQNLDFTIIINRSKFHTVNYWSTTYCKCMKSFLFLTIATAFIKSQNGLASIPENSTISFVSFIDYLFVDSILCSPCSHQYANSILAPLVQDLLVSICSSRRPDS
jgi:hypothetical protein